MIFFSLLDCPSWQRGQQREVREDHRTRRGPVARPVLHLRQDPLRGHPGKRGGPPQVRDPGPIPARRPHYRKEGPERKLAILVLAVPELGYEGGLKSS